MRENYNGEKLTVAQQSITTRTRAIPDVRTLRAALVVAVICCSMTASALADGPRIYRAIYRNPVSEPAVARTVGHRHYSGYRGSHYRHGYYRHGGASVSIGFRYGSFGPRFYGYSPYNRYSYYGPDYRSYAYSYYRPRYSSSLYSYRPYSYTFGGSYGYSPYSYASARPYAYYQPAPVYYQSFAVYPQQSYAIQPYSFYHCWHGYCRPYCF